MQNFVTRTNSRIHQGCQTCLLIDQFMSKIAFPVPFKLLKKYFNQQKIPCQSKKGLIHGQTNLLKFFCKYLLIHVRGDFKSCNQSLQRTLRHYGTSHIVSKFSKIPYFKVAIFKTFSATSEGINKHIAKCFVSKIIMLLSRCFQKVYKKYFPVSVGNENFQERRSKRADGVNSKVTFQGSGYKKATL